MGLRHWLILIFMIIAACNTSSQYTAICEEAANSTHLEIEQNLVNRRLIWHTTVSDVVFTNEGDYLVFIQNDSIQVNYVPKEIAIELHKGDPFNFIGTITKFNERCFGEVEFNELNQ